MEHEQLHKLRIFEQSSFSSSEAAVQCEFTTLKSTCSFTRKRLPPSSPQLLSGKNGVY